MADRCAVCGTTLASEQTAATDAGWGGACSAHTARHAATPACGPSGLTVRDCKRSICDCLAAPVDAARVPAPAPRGLTPADLDVLWREAARERATRRVSPAPRGFRGAVPLTMGEMAVSKQVDEPVGEQVDLLAALQRSVERAKATRDGAQ